MRKKNVYSRNVLFGISRDRNNASYIIRVSDKVSERDLVKLRDKAFKLSGIKFPSWYDEKSKRVKRVKDDKDLLRKYKNMQSLLYRYKKGLVGKNSKKK